MLGRRRAAYTHPVSKLHHWVSLDMNHLLIFALRLLAVGPYALDTLDVLHPYLYLSISVAEIYIYMRPQLQADSSKIYSVKHLAGSTLF
ncbi:hypothetical protein A0H81_06745 [Grifola frondosa]|uniref:Uncharacterized protein n=1 Tax=Grifola frondosa TaxID=5627 RepID=A0A1C7M8E0_GRIFR|nr:hypothetical protein A0H81_06745 [Grifola frondosa]